MGKFYGRIFFTFWYAYIGCGALLLGGSHHGSYFGSLRKRHAFLSFRFLFFPVLAVVFGVLGVIYEAIVGGIILAIGCIFLVSYFSDKARDIEKEQDREREERIKKNMELARQRHEALENQE